MMYYVIGWFVMGVIAVISDVYMINNYYSKVQPSSMKHNKGDVAAMIFGCMCLWWLVIPFHIMFIAIVKIQKCIK